jgi:hypothetical protein
VVVEEAAALAGRAVVACHGGLSDGVGRLCAALSLIRTTPMKRQSAISAAILRCAAGTGDRVRWRLAALAGAARLVAVLDVRPDDPRPTFLGTPSRTCPTSLHGCGLPATPRLPGSLSQPGSPAFWRSYSGPKTGRLPRPADSEDKQAPKTSRAASPRAAKSSENPVPCDGVYGLVQARGRTP